MKEEYAALGMVESTSIAAGIEAGDSMLKAAGVMRNISKNLFARPKECLEEVGELVNQMVVAFLDQPEAALHVMGEHAAGEEAYFHGLNVSILSMMLAKDLGFSRSQSQLLGVGALLVGFVPTAVFHANGLIGLGRLLALLVDTHRAGQEIGVSAHLLRRRQAGWWRRTGLGFSHHRGWHRLFVHHDGGGRRHSAHTLGDAGGGLGRRGDHKGGCSYGGGSRVGQRASTFRGHGRCVCACRPRRTDVHQRGR